jgi:hypothetical protein
MARQVESLHVISGGCEVVTLSLLGLKAGVSRGGTDETIRAIIHDLHCDD